MPAIRIKDLLNASEPQPAVHVNGWVRTKRDSKTFSFLEINDGSCLASLQVIADAGLGNYESVKQLTTGSAVAIAGDLIESQGKGQKWEIQCRQVDILSIAPVEFPLQKKRHTDEYLRTIAHLRPRTNKYGAIFRIRSKLAYAVHQFFNERGFFYVHTPILTGSDCEGAGELFRVTSLDLNNLPLKDGNLDDSADFFGTPANLTVSGQLSAEMMALSLGQVYTFGPTFRAENSNTSRHVAEFWMIEPEMAFCDLGCNMDLGQEMLVYLTTYLMDHCSQDLQLFARFVDKGLMTRLEGLIQNEYVRLPYAEAIQILSSAGQKFAYPCTFGNDLQSEHERFLTEVHFKKPVFIFDWPANIKPFYMRLNDDQQTVAAMDLIVPHVGELIGGSQREERLDVLEQRMREAGIEVGDYWWYLDSRRFGSVPHSGFGLGFERLIMLLTGVTNIRDVIPFPRTPKNIDF